MNFKNNFIHKANQSSTATQEIKNPVEFKCGASCLDVVQPRFHVRTYTRTYVAGIRLPEAKPRAGSLRSRVAGEVVTEIACGRKRQSKHRGREVFWKARPVLTSEYKTHVKMERPSQSTTYVWHWAADEMIGSVKSSCSFTGNEQQKATGRLAVCSV